jgi:hypothetical protein
MLMLSRQLDHKVLNVHGEGATVYVVSISMKPQACHKTKPQ